VTIPAVAPATGDTRPDGAVGAAAGRTDTALRVVSHVAAELPLVVLGIVELTRGWRPLYDNADLALRSYQVLSSHSPLVGHQMAVSAGSHAVFGPGPLQNWILAVPVRLDPAQGVLWGSLLAVVAAVALAVEAAWAVAGWRGTAVAAGSVLVLCLSRTDAALDVAWNVWFGLCFLLTTVATALAVATGRLRWWPVTVVAATVVVQCQAAFAPPAVAVCLVAPVVCLVGDGAGRQKRRTGYAWLLVGLGAGAAVWAAPLAQEVTARPGNLTLLARAARESGPSIGWSAALHAFGGATEVPPSWVHQLAPSGAARFFAVAGTFSGRRGGAWRFRCSWPASPFLVVSYLGALWVPVGTAVWVTLAWAVGEVALGAARRRGGGGGLDPSEPAGIGWQRPAAMASAALLVLASATSPWSRAWPTCSRPAASTPARTRPSPTPPQDGRRRTGPRWCSPFLSTATG